MSGFLHLAQCFQGSSMWQDFVSEYDFNGWKEPQKSLGEDAGQTLALYTKSALVIDIQL